jgi:hypothetical protein
MAEETPKRAGWLDPFRAVRRLVWTIACAGPSVYRSIVKLDEYTPFPLLTPHTKADIERVADAARISAGKVPEEGSAGEADRISSEKSYLFIDRGVSRAQGLLAFNSIVFAGMTFELGKSFYILGKIVCTVTVALLLISTLLSLLSTLIIWFAPEAHDDRREESSRIWKIWAYRALMFNVAVFLSAISFVLLSSIIAVKIWTR